MNKVLFYLKKKKLLLLLLLLLGEPRLWGNPPVHIISHFSLITFT